MDDLLRLGRPRPMMSTDLDDTDGLYLDKDTALRRDVLGREMSIDPRLSKSVARLPEPQETAPRQALTPEPTASEQATFAVPSAWKSGAESKPASKPAAEQTEKPAFAVPSSWMKSADTEPQTPAKKPGLLERTGNAIDSGITSLFGDNKPTESQINKQGLADYKEQEAEQLAKVAARREELGTDSKDRGDAMKLFDSAAGQFGGAISGTLEFIADKVGSDSLKALAEAGKREAMALAPREQTTAQKLAGAAGSMLAFVAPGMGVGKGLQLAGMGVAAARTAAAGAAAVLESAGVAQEAFEKAMSETGNKELANERAWIAGAANLPLTWVTNRLGIFGEGSALRQLGSTLLTEGGQEGSQQILTNKAGFKEVGEGVSESTAIGALAGGGFKGGQLALERLFKEATPQERDDLVKGLMDEGTAARQQVYDAMMQDERSAEIIKASGIESASDPRFQGIAIQIGKLDRQLRDLDMKTDEEIAAERKRREEDVKAAFGTTASTGVGVGTGANDPLIRRDSVTPNNETRTLEGDAKPVVLPEGETTPAGTLALSPEDLAARKEGYEVQTAFAVGPNTVGNRFVSLQQAETFLLGPKNKKTGEREGGYASTVEDMDFRIRAGKRSKQAGGGTFYFIEGKPKTAVSSAAAEIDSKAHEAATSPLNDLPQPTEAQKATGTYKKGRVKVLGLNIAVENPQGSERSGTDASGNAWRQEMQHHYGYVSRTKGKDGDQVDVFIGPNPESQKVFVVDQINPDGTFDEHKAMLGFNTLEEAQAGYLANYEPGWQGLGAISEMPADAFKSWIKDGKVKRKPLAYTQPAQADVSPASTQQPAQTEQAVEQQTVEAPAPAAPVAPVVSAATSEAAPAVEPAAEAVPGADVPKQERTTGRKRSAGATLRANTFAKNPFLAFIGKHGINLSLKSEFSPDKNPMISGYGPMFRRSGLLLDDLAVMAAQDGYLPRNFMEEDGTYQLEEMIGSLLRGTRIDPVYGFDGDTILEQRFAEEAERQREIEAEQSVLPEDADGYAAAEREAIQAVDQLTDTELFDLDDAVLSGESNVSTADAMRALGFTEQEIQDELERQGKKDASSEGSVQAASEQESGAGEAGAGKARPEQRTEDQVTEPKQTVEQKLKAKAKKAKAIKVEQGTEPQKRDANQAKADKKIGKKKAVKAEVIELWEDNDDGQTPHVAWESLPAEMQQDWQAAVEDGYATIDLHDRMVQTALKNARADRINAKVQRTAEEDDGTFRLASGGKGMEVSALQKIVDAFKANWANLPEIVVVASERDLPARLYGQVQRENVEGMIAGAFWNGKVYLVARNTTDMKDAVVSIYHEVAGHFGLRSILGDQHAATMRLAYDSSKSVRAAADKMMVNEGLDLETAVEEVLADMAESEAWKKPENQTAFQKIYSAIRTFLRDTFGVKFISDAEIRELVASARRHVETGDVEMRGQGGTAAANASMQEARAAKRQLTQTFYSALERSVRADKRDSAQPKDWKAIISKLPGIKKEEIEWTGVSEWLDTLADEGVKKVAKQDVLNFIAGNKLHLNDVILEGTGKFLTDEDITELYAVHMGVGFEDVMGMSRDDMLQEMGMDEADTRGTKHGQGKLGRVLPGGKKQFELVLVEPSQRTRPYKEWDDIHFGDVSGGKHLGWLRGNLRKDMDGNDVLFLEEIQSQRGQDGQENGFGTGEDQVPEAPFMKDTKAWTALLLKRAIAYAQEKGINRIAWTTGEQQVDRYRMSKTIDTLSYVKDKKTGKVTIGATKNGQTVIDKEVEPDKVKSVVGADLAAQIEQNNGLEINNENETSGIISGLDLDVGGDGLRNYYNRTVSSVADKFLKDFGGKVEVMQIEGTGQQLGFVVPESLQKQVSEDGLPMFRRKDYESQFSDLPASVREMALAKGHYSPPTIKERLEALKPRMWLRVVQKTFDRFRPVRDIDLKAYMQLRLSSGPQDGAVSGLLHYGQVFNDDGALNLKKGTKGLLDILKPVGPEVDRFLMWVAANRAAQLKKQDRENFFTDAEIAALTLINRGNMKDGSSRAGVYATTLAQMNELNRSVLDVARSTGLIDEASYKRFSSDIWYIPFYRQMDADGTLSAANTSSAAVGQYLSKQLKGSTRQLNDLMENVLLNWSHILSASMKNQAANATLDSAVEMGDIVAKLTPLGDGKFGKDAAGNKVPLKYAVKTMVKGREAYWEIKDEFLLASLDAVASTPQATWWLDIARSFKTTLTRMISLSPTFKVNNLIRDAVQSVGLSELSNNPFKNVMQGYKAYHGERAEALVGGGLFAMGNAFDGDAASNVKRMLKTGVQSEDILTTTEKAKAGLKRWWDKYDELSDAMENSNRLALYQQLRSNGATHLEAAYAARDLQDFSLQGSGTLIRYLTQIVPYFNARLQGMYKLGRDGLDPVVQVLGGEADVSTRQKAAKFSTVLGAVTLMGVALYLANKDDEDFKKLEEWQRDSFFWVKIPGTSNWLRIPKPFEMGAFATVAERLTEQMVDDTVEGKVFGQRLMHVLMDNLAMNPMPQVFKPMYEIATNEDGFTGRPIESGAMSGPNAPSKPNRINQGTSALAVGLNKVNALFANGMEAATGGAVKADDMQFSPIQIDYLIRGYLGWMGGAILTTSNMATAAVKDGESSRFERIDDFLVIGNYVKTLPQGQSKYVTSFYENAKIAATVTADYQNFIKLGQFEKAQELAETKGSLLSLNKLYTKASSTMSGLTQQIKLIEQDTEMPGSVKRAEIEKLEQLRIDYAQQIEEARKSRR